METENESGGSWGSWEDVRGSVLGEWVPLSYLPPVELSTPPAPPKRRLRRLIRTSLQVSVYAALAIIFGFLGGWLGPSVFQDDSPSASSPDKLVATLLPEGGVTLDVRWGDLPRQLVEEGVIDLEKFKSAAQKAGSPLTADQLVVLSEDSDDPITFDAGNAYFLLDVLWALGLANKNAVLTEGPMAQRGWDQAGGLASTGGWTLGAKAGPEYLAALELISLTPQQQAIVDEVAYNAYRPCCGNMTAFPDCNHGMAALALTELMASQGANADEIFQALKEVSPFWFPTQYHHLALYFELRDQEWKDVDPRMVMGNEYSSGGGWKQVNAQLQQQGVLGTGGVGGGNASGCAP